MALKIGSQPVVADGEEALTVIARGLAKSANRAIDASTVGVKIRRADGEVTELQSGDTLELSASIAVNKAAKKDKPPKPPKPAKAAS